MELVNIMGSASALVYLSRVPSIGEQVLVNGLLRKVVGVAHYPKLPEAAALPWALAGGPMPQPAVVTWTGIVRGPQVPAAIVTVADE